VVERVVSEAQIERAMHEPPDDTRAWTRAMLLRMAGPDEISHVDWDTMRFRDPGEDRWGADRTLEMRNPLEMTQTESGPLLAGVTNVQDALSVLRVPSRTAEDAPPAGTAMQYGYKAAAIYPLARIVPERTSDGCAQGPEGQAQGRAPARRMRANESVQMGENGLSSDTKDKGGIGDGKSGKMDP
jgi:hypothetical protein